jgi:predicted amidohydrolase
MPSLGRAQDYRVLVACSRYSRAEDGWITNKFPPYRGSPVGRSYVVNREGQRIACTTRKGSVATAVIPAQDLKLTGRRANPQPAFVAITAPVALPEPRQWSKRRVRVTAIENHVGFDNLLNQLDQAGELGSDIVCTYEFVWVPVHGKAPDAERTAQLEATGRDRCAQVAAKAKQWNMYVILCGVLRDREINEAIVFDRQGRELGRYIKMATTYPEQVAGTETPVFETDFGRIAVRICADNWMVQQDRCYSIKGADIVFFSTQDWGPDAIYRNLRAISRCMDGQFFHVQATHSCTEAMHRSVVIDPAGVPVARSALQRPGLVSAVIDLDNDRPRRYLRRFTAHTPAGYLPQYQPTEFPTVKNDLKQTILKQRRPELYQILGPKKTAAK